MQACRTHSSTQQRPAPKRRTALLAGLFWGLAVGIAGPTFGEQQPDTTFNADVEEAVEGVPHHWQQLEATHLDDIRGRFVPAKELDVNAPWSVILWDEGRGGHSGSGNGSGSHQTQQGSNQQRHSLRTTTAR